MAAQRRRRRRRGCIYARYSTRFQESIEDQIRVCRKWAEENEVEISDVHIFTDTAESGKSHRRAGLAAMLAALAADEVDVVISFATNRIFRKVYRALQFVEEQIVDRKKRCVFVVQSIDTDKTEFWRNLLQVFAMVDEMQVQMLGGQIRAAQEGLLLKNFIHGTITFGYCGREVSGPLTRQGKVRREWCIDPDTSPWVVKIFRWFVENKWRYSKIARQLRQAGVKTPPRVNHWTRGAVKHVLTNRRYLGDFSYGCTETVWQNKAGYSRQFDREEPRMRHQNESLRIIDDELFYAAQERAAKMEGSGGREKAAFPEAEDHLLRGLLWCPNHRRALTVTGPHGGQLACRECKRRDDQALYSHVNRQLAERLICQTLAHHINTDADLVQQIIAAAQRQAESLQAVDPAQLQSLERELKAINTKVDFILDNPGAARHSPAEHALRR